MGKRQARSRERRRVVFLKDEGGQVSRQSAVQINADELRKYRRSKRESQGLFWSRFGVTQSRGSRFEKGAEIPRPVAILLELYLSGVLTDGHLGPARTQQPTATPTVVVGAVPEPVKQAA